nr:MAG TPA: hypothetical protein [Caudoviricetes sp.]
MIEFTYTSCYIKIIFWWENDKILRNNLILMVPIIGIKQRCNQLIKIGLTLKQILNAPIYAPSFMVSHPLCIYSADRFKKWRYGYRHF